MEKKIIYFNRKKAWLNIGTGLAIFLGSKIFVPGIFALMMFFVAGSFIYFGLKSISGKPQMIISDEGLFIGFKFKKTISWKSIERVRIKVKEVDFRKLKYIEIAIKVNINGPSNLTLRDFLVENLDTKPEEIENLINERLHKVFTN